MVGRVAIGRARSARVELTRANEGTPGGLGSGAGRSGPGGGGGGGPAPSRGSGELPRNCSPKRRTKGRGPWRRLFEKDPTRAVLVDRIAFSALHPGRNCRIPNLATSSPRVSKTTCTTSQSSPGQWRLPRWVEAVPASNSLAAATGKGAFWHKQETTSGTMRSNRRQGGRHDGSGLRPACFPKTGGRGRCARSGPPNRHSGSEHAGATTRCPTDGRGLRVLEPRRGGFRRSAGRSHGASRRAHAQR